MKLFGTLKRRISDDEYIETLRRSIAIADRWRFWLILLQVGLLITVVVVCSTFIPKLLQLAPANAPLAFFGLATGVFIGFNFGFLIHGIINSLISVLFGMRTERLLVKHYDAARSYLREVQKSDQSELEGEEIQDTRNMM